ncbi:hypothetical protein [Terricaulis sp.]|uniref:hypothetical protein n=1 Tax=Terricaulis sp. TaxID=2768686 RepID=UPI00378386C2
MRKGAILVGLALSLGGCASAGADAPAWFQQRTAENDSSYPSLRSVPREHDANVSRAHWNAVERETMAAAAQMRANPRATFGEPPQDPASFIDEARQALEASREAHE